MPELVVGPMLRYVDDTQATVFVETDAACEVSVLDARSRTFCVEGRHYALVAVGGLTPGSETEYTVALDGRTVWPAEGSQLPPSRIRTVAGERLTLAFGSCRVAAPHEPPWSLTAGEHPLGKGVDALRLLAQRLMDGPERRPDALLMLGDQVYADDPPPRVAEEVGSPDGVPGTPPGGHLEGFSDYAFAYRQAWSDPAVRWLLSTVPTMMIFDDHEIVDEWQLSREWLDDYRAKDWYDRRVTAGLMAYWLYQHLGNLSPQELESDELLQTVRRAGDGGPALRDFARDADRQVSRSHWSFARDLGPARLVVIDTRAGRRMEDGERLLVREPEWRWIDERMTGDMDHLLVGTSLPAFLAPGMHGLEAFDERLAQGRWGPRAARRGEWLRRELHLGHWAGFDASFRRLCESLTAVAAGRRGRPPASILMLAGDVHHAYVTRISLPEATSAVWELVASSFRKELTPKERRAMRFGASRAGALIGRGLRRLAGVPPPPASWEIVDRPTYDNNVATLTLDGPRAEVCIETVVGDPQDPRLADWVERRLV